MILCQQQKLNIHLIFQDQIENRSNSFLFVNATKIYQLKARDSEIKKCQLRLGNISEDFLANNLKKNKIKWVRVRFVDYRAFDTSNIIPIHKYLMTNDDIK